MDNNQATIFIVFLILILILSIVLIIISSLSLQGIQGGNKRASGGSRLEELKALSEEDFKRLENFASIDKLYKELGDTKFPKPSLNDIINEQSRDSLLHNIQLAIDHTISTVEQRKIINSIRDKLLTKYDELTSLIEDAQEAESRKLAQKLYQEEEAEAAELEERKRQEELETNKFFANEQPHSSRAYEQPHSSRAYAKNNTIMNTYGIKDPNVIEGLNNQYTWHNSAKMPFNDFMVDKYKKYLSTTTWGPYSISFEEYCRNN